MVDFDKKVKEHIGSFDGTLILQTKADDPEEEVFEPTVGNEQSDPNDDPDPADDPDARGFDPLVRAQVILAHKEGDMMATVLGRKRDADGNMVGRKHKIPT
jgi:hypothetical protein